MHFLFGYGNLLCYQNFPLDVRFIENIIRTVEKTHSNSESIRWEGSDDWIRSKFVEYLESFLCVMTTVDGIFDNKEQLDLGNNSISLQYLFIIYYSFV